MGRENELYSEGMELYELEDYDNAYIRFLTAAKNYGHSPSMFMAGSMLCATGDYEHGLVFVQASAEDGYPKAQSCLGALLYVGDIIERDSVRAFQLFKSAAEQGDTDALLYLGFCYEDGEVTEKDDEKAFEYYLKSAESGNAEGQFNAGLCYENGKGTEKDPELAIYWYRKAAEQEHEEAKKKLEL